MENNEKKRKTLARIIHWGIPILLILVTLSLLTYCALFHHSHYEAHGIGNYRFDSHYDFPFQYNSPVETDVFVQMAPFKDDFECVECDYYYVYDEYGFMLNALDRALYYYVYSEADYLAAKAYCFDQCTTIGTEPTEEYNGYLFYDFYGTRDKEEYYHGDDYPQAFKRVIFNDEKHVILFLGVNSDVVRAKTLANEVNDWEEFLRTYFSDWYSFD